MRSFNASFVTQKNKRADGPVPINLVTVNFDTPIYLSDRDVTPSGGSAHTGLVQSWGFMDSAVSRTPGSSILGKLDVADLRLVIINTTDPRFSDNFTVTDPPENVTVEVYQWFDGLLDSEKELIFKGVISGPPAYDEQTCTLVVRSIWEQYNCHLADTRITADEFASADPDDIGKSQNIVYGQVVNVPCRAVESGAVDSILDDITDTQTSIELSDAAEFPSSGTVQIDEEKITYTGISTNTLTGCTRGADSTNAAVHTSGVSCWEVKTRFVYQIAGHPVKTVHEVYVDDFRVTPVATMYTGQSGDELSGYEDMAVLTVPARLTRQQAVSLGLDDTIDVDDSLTISDTIAVDDTIDVDDTIGVDDNISVSDNIDFTVPGSTKEIYPDSGQGNARDGNEESHYDMVAYDTDTWGFPATSYGTISKQYFWVRISTTGGVEIQSHNGGAASLGTLTNAAEGWYRFESTNTDWDLALRVVCGAGEAATVYEIKKVVEYTASSSKTGSASRSGAVSKTGAATKSGSASKTGTVTRSGTVSKTGTVNLTGNSVSDVEIGRLVTCDVDGYQDDGAGTYTGTPDALIQQPDHVLTHIWCELLGAPAGDIDTARFNAAGAFYAAWSYQFALLIHEPTQAGDLLASLALQCRSRFFVSPAGVACLVVRQLNQPSTHSVAKAEIKRDSMGVQHSAVADVINSFNVHYDLDHRQQQNRAENYRAVKNFSDTTSISRYGTQQLENEQLFCFDAVTQDAMAAHVGSFLLDWHARVRKMPGFAVFLDNLEIEPGDVIDITHDLDDMAAFVCEVLKIVHQPGSGRQAVVDHIKIVAIHNTT